MLTRIFIDNFRCFDNFEYCPGRRQLILGANGSGKSSMMDALVAVRHFAVEGLPIDEVMVLQRTRWLSKAEQTFEIEAEIEGQSYTYTLRTDLVGAQARPRVLLERVTCDGRAIFEFEMGEVRLFTGDFAQSAVFHSDWHRSAFATVGLSSQDNRALAVFGKWFSSLRFFRINPFGMGSSAERDDLGPMVDLRNFAPWYGHLLHSLPHVDSAMRKDLQQVFEGFATLRFQQLGPSTKALVADFRNTAGAPATFFFHELSEGQKCLAALYAILWFVLAQGHTVFIDEPENFIALREIQPWLMSATDAVDDGKGQLILVSHHPELINQWAPGFGVQFVREAAGVVRVKPFAGDPDSPLTPAELMARGWDDE